MHEFVHDMAVQGDLIRLFSNLTQNYLHLVTRSDWESWIMQQ